MKRSGTSWIKEWRIVVGLAALAFVPLGLSWMRMPRFWGPGLTRENNRKRGCRNNLHQLSLAVQFYSQDNDNRYPPVLIGGTSVSGWPSLSMTTSVSRKLSTSFSVGVPPKTLPVGWVDAFMPYYRSESILMCPAEHSGNDNSANPSKVGYTDYWMNGNLSGRLKMQVASPAATLLLGEGNDGHDQSNATYSQTALPPAWLKDQSSPAWRHLDGANYLMVDGTVHWLRPQEVTHFGERKDAFARR